MTITLIEKNLTPEQKELLKRTVCKGATDDQLGLFEYVCSRSGLDPFLKQIYGIIRRSKDGTPTMTIQTSIDGLRLIADRSGNYSPGRESTFTYDKDGRVFSSTSYVKKRTKDGSWHEVAATAIVSEYKPKYANDFWDTKTHLMIAKCAEAAALRKAFPAEMCGIYTKDEMEQVKDDEPSGLLEAEFEDLKKSKENIPMIEEIVCISESQRNEIEEIGKLLEKETYDGFIQWINIEYKCPLEQIPKKAFQRCYNLVVRKLKDQNMKNKENVNEAN